MAAPVPEIMDSSDSGTNHFTLQAIISHLRKLNFLNEWQMTQHNWKLVHHATFILPRTLVLSNQGTHWK
jgi:hypothetical protein